jgi:NADPH:quinone reductase-like Zn-dependent oxidoreductase
MEGTGGRRVPKLAWDKAFQFFDHTGKLRPLVDEETFSLEDVGKAHARLEAGKAMGKIAVVNKW